MAGRQQTVTPDGTAHVFIGDSHLFAVQDALAARPDLAGQVEIIQLRDGSVSPPIMKSDTGDKILNPLITARMERFADRPVRVHAAFRGNDHNALSLVQHARPFDFVLEPGDLVEIEDGVELLPRDAVEAALFMASRRVFRLLSHLSTALPENATLDILEPPPPVRSEAHLRANPGVFDAEITVHGIGPWPFRLKIWQLYCRMLQDHAAEHALGYVATPTTALDGPGLLKPGFWAADPTHTNADYGAHLLDWLISADDTREGTYG